MLQHDALYFSRCDLLGDPYEGYHPKALADGEDAFVAMIKEKSDVGDLVDAEVAARQAYKQLLELPKRIRTEMFVSCWHMNEEESWAMWKLYTSHDKSICIRSTYQSLGNVLPSECYWGRVKYIDYRHDNFDVGNLLNYIIHKRKSFEHEREARAVIWKPAGATDKPFRDVAGEGLVVPVDLTKLINEIFVSPNSKLMLRDLVEGLVQKYGLNVQVNQSSVNDPPPY